MKTIAALVAKSLGNFLSKDFREVFGSGRQDIAERLGTLARSTVECLGRSDALYHNLEHTVLVTLVGRDILRGRMMCERIEPPTMLISLSLACSTTSVMCGEF